MKSNDINDFDNGTDQGHIEFEKFVDEFMGCSQLINEVQYEKAIKNNEKILFMPAKPI